MRFKVKNGPFWEEEVEAPDAEESIRRALKKRIKDKGKILAEWHFMPECLKVTQVHSDLPRLVFQVFWTSWNVFEVTPVEASV